MSRYGVSKFELLTSKENARSMTKQVSACMALSMSCRASQLTNNRTQS